MKATIIVGLVATLVLAFSAATVVAGTKPDLRGCTEAQERTIADALHAYRRYIPDSQEIVFFCSRDPGAYATEGASGRWYVKLGTTVWSRSAAEAHSYPSYNTRSDEELARVMVGHELGHLVLSGEDELLYQGMLDIDNYDYAKEEAATVFSFRVQRIPLHLFESDVSRRMVMCHWYNAVR